MKRTLHVLRSVAAFSASIVLLFSFTLLTSSAWAGIKTWSGNGLDNKWQTPPNWVGGVAPSPGDSLIFTLTTRISSTNDFPAGTLFNGITFQTPAAAFALNGASINEGGDIVDNQTVLTETINLPLSLSVTPNVNVAGNCFLTFSAPISGSGFGLNKIGAGQVNLTATNSFNGGLTINSGTVFVNSDANVGAVPAVATPGSIAITGGSLRTTNSFILSTNRGIALGPVSGSGVGTIDVGAGATMTYRGVIANNTGASGSLAKLSFGGLTLGASNTYSGATLIQNGTLTLDFTAGTAPLANIINPVSPLTLGGANAGFGATNAAVLVMNPKGTNVTSQSFASTHVTFGGAVIQVNSNAQAAATLNLGALDHDPGGVLVLVTPKLAGLTNGNITTTTTNVNGILGGWATISGGSNLFGIVIGTNFACVDTNGNIINFSNYLAYTSGNLHGVVGPTNNLLINSASSGDIVVDADNAGTTNDVNALNVRRWENGGSASFSLIIGTSNTLRLGKFGAIFKSDSTQNIWLIGETAGGANGADQNIGRLTAGGPNNNSPGEIVVDVNNTSESTGTTIIDAQVTDNGTGQVTFVKTGPGSMKLRGHNTYSGGTFLLQGRVQFVGAEGGVGTGNADGGGTGPIYILPGCYLFPSGTGPTDPVTNQVYIAGNGTVGEPLGSMRLSTGWNFAGPMTLIGDTTLGGSGGASGGISGQISGPFSMAFCSPATVNGTVSISNPNNNWTGNTVMNGRNTGANIFLSGTNECIPNGFTAGNVTMSGVAGGTITWDLNGFNETINGFSTVGNGISCLVQNGGTVTSTLTVGDNDQSGTFGGIIQDGTGKVALVKIGQGIETLTVTNTYTGNTTVIGTNGSGTLALTGTGVIANSPSIVVSNGGTLDVSGLAFGTVFAATNAVQLTSGGDLFANTIKSTCGNLAMTNGALTVLADTASTNVITGSLNLGGASNVLNIVSVANVVGYPSVFPLVKYTGSLGGANNFVLGSVPNSSTVGYVSNDAPHSMLVLVLLNGPKPLTWVGNDPVNPTFWDLNVTTNWIGFKGFPSQTNVPFNTADQVFVDDTAATNVLNLTQSLLPGGVVVSNNIQNFTFTGPGSMSGLWALQKQGSATLTLTETGGDGFKNGVVVGGGTLVFGSDTASSGGATIGVGTVVQVGVNAGTGSLPSGTVINNGSLVFNRGADLTVPNDIGGAGGISKIDANIVSLNGNNTFTGAVAIVNGTIKAGSAAALGTTNNGTTISSGATLDVNGQILTNEPISVVGAGVGSNGAIINSGAAQNNSLRVVTATGNTTFGGSARWDIRETVTTANNESADASLSGTTPYALTKVGNNQVSLVGATIDNNLENINVQAGILSFQLSTTSMGDPAGTVTVSAGATLDVFNSPNAFNKNYILNGNGTSNTLSVSSGSGTFTGPVTINGSNIWNVAGTQMTLDNNSTITGTGNLNITGTGNLTLSSSTINYTGNTTLKGGKLTLNGLNTGGGTLSNLAGTTLAGNGGGNTGPVGIAGNVTPGDGQSLGTIHTGNLTMSNATMTARLQGSSGGSYDQIAATGNLVLLGTNTITPVPSLNSLHVNDTLDVITYTGTLTGTTNNIKLLPAPVGYVLTLLDPATTPGVIRIHVDRVPLNLVWQGGAAGNPNLWDITVTNWLNNSAPSLFTTGDEVNFNEGASTSTVTMTNSVQPIDIEFNNGPTTYTFTGAGKLTGLTTINMNGGGKTIFANTGTNDFTNAININAGSTLQVGNGGTAGNLSAGPVTNGLFSQGFLVFNRSDSITVTNVISSTAPSSVIEVKTGTVTLSGNNQNYGQGVPVTVEVDSGTTLKLGNSAALGTNIFNTVQVSGTLDIGTNTINIGLLPITVAGAGVGGNGAIVNNSGSSGFVAPNFAYVNMTNDLTIGGSGRLDWRANPATTNLAGLTITDGQPHKLIKISTNQLALAGVQIDPNLGQIEVHGGIFGIQGMMPTLGIVNSNLIVFSNATLQFFAVSNVMYKNLILQDGAIVNNNSGLNIWGGPVTLQGSNNFNIAGTWLAISNVISGSGTLSMVTGGSVLFLPVTNNYTGPTFINAGTLALTNDPATGLDGSISTSPTITVGSGATLDASGRSDGTLTLAGGQTLKGFGTVRGLLVAGAGSTVSPGGSIGTLTVSTNITLGGTTFMEISKSPKTNDVLRNTAGSITYGGSLIVTNIAGNLTGGESFKIFSAGNSNYFGSFGSITLPTLAPGLSWNNQLSASGTISVSGTLTFHPAIGSMSFSAPTLSLSGSNGIPNGTYVVIGSTNVSLPLSSWTPIVTNTFDASGNFSWSGNVGTTNVQRFFTIRE